MENGIIYDDIPESEKAVKGVKKSALSSRGDLYQWSLEGNILYEDDVLNESLRSRFSMEAFRNTVISVMRNIK